MAATSAQPKAARGATAASGGRKQCTSAPRSMSRKLEAVSLPKASRASATSEPDAGSGPGSRRGSPVPSGGRRGWPVASLTACPAAARRALLTSVADGSVNLLVGTHAVIEEDVRFKNVALAVVDRARCPARAHRREHERAAHGPERHLLHGPRRMSGQQRGQRPRRRGQRLAGEARRARRDDGEASYPGLVHDQRIPLGQQRREPRKITACHLGSGRDRRRRRSSGGDRRSRPGRGRCFGPR